jgi:hypothetical protein
MCALLGASACASVYVRMPSVSSLGTGVYRGIPEVPPYGTRCAGHPREIYGAWWACPVGVCVCRMLGLLRARTRAHRACGSLCVRAHLGRPGVCSIDPATTSTITHPRALAHRHARRHIRACFARTRVDTCVYDTRAQTCTPTLTQTCERTHTTQQSRSHGYIHTLTTPRTDA